MKRSRGNNNDEGPAATVNDALLAENKVIIIINIIIIIIIIVTITTTTIIIIIIKVLRIRCDELESINDKYQSSQILIADLSNSLQQLRTSTDTDINNIRLLLSAAEAEASQLHIDKENLELQIAKLRSNIMTYKQQLSLAETKRYQHHQQHHQQQHHLHHQHHHHHEGLS